MTEKDIIKHAQGYIRQLSNGIDPISGQSVSEDSVLSQDRLRKCFSYVDGILQQVLEGRYVTRNYGKKQFFVKEGLKEKIKVQDSPITLPDFIKNVQTADEKLGKLHFRQVTSWLIKKGYMVEVPYGNGKTRKQGTPQGEKVGIFNVTKTGQKGDYIVVTYNSQAQKMLIDFLDEIAAKK